MKVPHNSATRARLLLMSERFCHSANEYTMDIQAREPDSGRTGSHPCGENKDRESLDSQVFQLVIEFLTNKMGLFLKPLNHNY
jgi:hypothetical protein